MYLEQLNYFVEVANTKSMSAAGHNLHVTQQNISKSIKQLESELGTQLFTRTSQGIFLTEIGKSVYIDALEILTQVSIFQKKYASPNPIQNKKCSLSILSIYGLDHLQTEITKIVTSQFINYDFNIFETNPSRVQQLLFDNKYDIIAMETDDLDDVYTKELTEIYHAFLVKEEKLRLHVSKLSPIAEQNNISINALAYLPLIAFCTEGTTPYFFDVLEKRKIKLNTVFTTNNILTAYNYVEAGSAYGLTTKYIYMNTGNSLTKNCTLIPLKEKINIYYILFMNKRAAIPTECANIIFNTLIEKYELLF